VGEGYRKLPLRYKLYLAAGLLGGSALAGGASALLTTVFASAKIGSRVLSGAGIYTLVEGMGESRLQTKESKSGFERSKLDSYQKHGLAVAAGILVASGLPGAAIRDLFIDGEKWGMALLHHYMPSESTSAHTTVSGGETQRAYNAPPADGKPNGPNGDHQTQETSQKQLAATAQTQKASGTPISTNNASQPPQQSAPLHNSSVKSPTIKHSALEQPAIKVPEMPKIPASKSGTEGMIKDLWKQLHDPSKHFTLPPNTDPKSDLARIWNADGKSIGSISHQISADPTHEWFKNGESLVVKPGEQMTIVNGELRIINAHGDLIKPSYEALPNHPTVSVNEAGDTTADQLNNNELNKLHPQKPIFEQPQATVSPNGDSVADSLNSAELTRVHAQDTAYAEWHDKQFSQPNIKPTIPPATQDSIPKPESTNPSSIQLEYSQPFINKLGLPVDPTHIHVFQDNEGKIIVYGNNYELRSDTALAYAQSHPDTIIWVQSDIPSKPDSTWRPSVFGVRYDSASGATESRTVAVGLINPDTFNKQLN
jgi:hypothetical protein